MYVGGVDGELIHAVDSNSIMLSDNRSRYCTFDIFLYVTKTNCVFLPVAPSTPSIRYAGI